MSGGVLRRVTGGRMGGRGGARLTKLSFPACCLTLTLTDKVSSSHLTIYSHPLISSLEWWGTFFCFQNCQPSQFANPLTLQGGGWEEKFLDKIFGAAQCPLRGGWQEESW